MGHGSGLGYHASNGFLFDSLSGRLVLSSSRAKVLWARDFLLSLCRSVGIQINVMKSNLVPSETATYLRMVISSIPLRVFPTREQLTKLSCQLTEFLSCRLQLISIWRSLLGQMSSLFSSGSGFSAPDVLPPVASQLILRFPSGKRIHFLGRLLPRGSSVVVSRRSSDPRGLSTVPSPSLPLLH